MAAGPYLGPVAAVHRWSPHACWQLHFVARGLPPAEQPAQLPFGWKCSCLLPPTGPIYNLGYRSPSSLSPWWDHSKASVYVNLRVHAEELGSNRPWW